MNRRTLPIGVLSAVGALYLALALGSLWLSRHQPGIASLWFANGMAIAVLTNTPRRQWAPLLGLVALGVFLANLVHGDAPLQALRFVPANLLEIWLGAWLLRRQRLVVPMMNNPYTFVRFLMAGAMLPPLASATVAATLMAGAEALAFERVWSAWYIGATVGAVASLPLCTTLMRLRPPIDWRKLLQPQVPLLACAVAAVSLLALLRLPSPYVYITGVLTYVAIQAGFLMVSALSLLSIAIAGLLIAIGALAVPPPDRQWDHALFYLPMLMSVVPPMLLSVALARKRRRSQLALARSKARYQRLYLRAPTMLHSMTIDGRIVSVSDFWLDKLKYRRSEVLDQPFTAFLGDASARLFEAQTMPQLRVRGTCKDVELEMRTSDHRTVLVNLSATAERTGYGQIVSLLAALEDVTDKRRLETALIEEHKRQISQAEAVAARMTHLAQHDPLTGLPNRLLFFDRLQQGLHVPRGGNPHLALIFIDLDHFKRINDNHGHQFGDELLRAIAQRLQTQVRASDTVCRIGGDEFVVMLPAVEQPLMVKEVVDKLMRAVGQPYRIGERVIEVSFSAGVAIAPIDGDSPESLINHADDAMYRAKHQGRNQVVAYSEV